MATSLSERALPLAVSVRSRVPDRYLLLALLGGAWLVLWYVLPIVLMLVRFFVEGDFLRLPALSSFEQTLYVRVYLNTFQMALGVTAECLVLGYIVAYMLYSAPRQLLGVLLSLVLIPFWISIIVRTYALLVVLGRNGIVNSTLIELSIVDEPLRIMFSTQAVYIGMAQALLPFMIFSIYSSLRGIDPDLPLAARALGAGALQVFLRVIFPLSMPGVWGGCTLVFILALGYFITPALLGGPRDVMIAQLIHQQAVLDGNFAGAVLLSIPLLVATLIIVAVFNRYFGLDRIWGGRA